MKVKKKQQRQHNNNIIAPVITDKIKSERERI